ncbi:ASCH domain-containing protein [Lachnoclostridium phytofermentans]|uniref:ASCH domain-containing protein n=1 Tax=Lachnoclostridium phytofermentans TaxID=66219 RepID=UPI00049847A0|nr:ASCH domain-containing protein [Lachnoclostridium phytofermentans]
MTLEEFWNDFIKCNQLKSTTTYIESFHFELTEKLANSLLELVLSGKKKATASSLLSYEIEGTRIPQVGDYSIVTDWDGVPRCVIETTAVTITPFSQITFDICKREGEDDTLESWQKGHKHFFVEEGKELGYSFSEDMSVVFEDFKVVFVR